MSQPIDGSNGTGESEDLTSTDHLVEQTDNQLTEEDPAEQPPQDPEFLPEGTESGE